jgi:hypothetical protein
LVSFVFYGIHRSASVIEFLDCHFGGSERAGLARADVVDEGKVLTRFILFNQQIVVSHSSARKGHGNAHCQGETLGDSYDHNRNRGCESSDKLLKGGIGKEIVIFVEHNLHHDKEYLEDKDDETSEFSPFANLLGKIVQSLLQMCLRLIFPLFNRVDLVPSGLVAHCED